MASRRFASIPVIGMHHIDLDRAIYGAYQSASVKPNRLHQLVGDVRKIEKALGYVQEKSSKTKLLLFNSLERIFDSSATVFLRSIP